MRTREILERRHAAAKVSLNLIEHGLAASISSDEWDQHGHFSTKHKEALTECLKCLRPDHRRIVVMRYQQQEACDHIAQATAMSLDAVYTALSRVRKRLKLCVERRLVLHS